MLRRHQKRDLVGLASYTKAASPVKYQERISLAVGPIKRLAAYQRSEYKPGEDYPWWADNAAHLVGGAVIGAIAHYGFGLGLLGTAVVFLICAVVWELYEFLYNVRPWDEREDWSVDRAIEDTMLDTYVGLTGAILMVL